jgi:hypothetical protein
MGVKTDPFGNVLVTGWMYGTVDFGGGPLTADDRDTFLLKLDSNGNHAWSKIFGGPGAQSGGGVRAAGSGNVYFSMSFAGSEDFGGGVLTSAGGTDLFLVKYDGNGNHIWSQNYGDANNQGGGVFAFDGMGNPMLSGIVNGSIDLGGGALTSAGGADILLAKIDPAGNHIWSRLHGGTGNEFCGNMTLDGFENIVVCGSFHNTVNFGGAPLTSAGGADIYFAKYDALGNHMWSTRFGDADDQYGELIAVDGSDDVIRAGSFQGTVDFGGGPMTATVSYFVYYHIFLTKFGDAPVPTLLQAYTADGVGKNIELKWTLADAGENMKFHVSRANAARRNFTELFNPAITQENLNFGFVDNSCSPGTRYFYQVDVTDEKGRRPLFQTEAIELLPLTASLEQNLPNPFNPTTTISYSVAKRSRVRLVIYDTDGRLVRTLVDEIVSAGSRDVTWEGLDQNGLQVSSGVYFYRLETGKKVLAKKMILLK